MKAPLPEATLRRVCGKVPLERRRMEVTSVRTPGEAPELIQVCADLGTPETTEREVRTLADAAKVYPKVTRRLLTLTRDAMPGQVPSNVVVQPGCVTGE